MASVKVKFRASSLPDHEGTLYYQIIHNRLPRQLLTDYHIFPSEWDEESGGVINPRKSKRSAIIKFILERIRWDNDRLHKIINHLESEGIDYTTDKIIEEFNKRASENSLFCFMQNAIFHLENSGKTRTAETYRATLLSFKKFREGQDIYLSSLNAKIMEEYQAWLNKRGASPNTISFYIRILRAVYNRAIEEEIIENRRPFRRVYTGVGKTVKRALPL